MSAISLREKVAFGLLSAEYLIPLFVPLVKIWTGEPHFDADPSYPTLALLSFAIIALWPLCLLASVLQRKRRLYYLTATLLFPAYTYGVLAIQPLFGVRT